MFASSVSCLCLIHGLECSCDQCLFTSTLPSLSRSHESDSLLPRSVCLFKIARHQIWGSHGVGGCVRPVLCFLELVDRPNHQLANVLFGWTGLKVFWFLVCVVSSPSFIWDGQKFALDGTRISQLPKFKLLNLIRNWNFTKKKRIVRQLCSQPASSPIPGRPAGLSSRWPISRLSSLWKWHRRWVDTWCRSSI